MKYKIINCNGEYFIHDIANKINIIHVFDVAENAKQITELILKTLNQIKED
jgi:predicted CoA-binding protein